MAGVTIEFAEPDLPPRRFVVVGSARVGRAEGDIRLSDPAVSRLHVQLDVGDDGVLVTDLGSTHGTFVDDQRITTPTLVTSGSTLLVGDTVLAVHDFSNEPAVPSERQALPGTATIEVASVVASGDGPAHGVSVSEPRSGEPLHVSWSRTDVVSAGLVHHVLAPGPTDEELAWVVTSTPHATWRSIDAGQRSVSLAVSLTGLTTARDRWLVHLHYRSGEETVLFADELSRISDTR